MLTNYYSRTYDVLAVAGEEDSCRLVTIATFSEREDALAFVKDHESNAVRCDGETVAMIGVRPPVMHVRDALDWLTLLRQYEWEQSLPDHTRR